MEMNYHYSYTSDTWQWLITLVTSVTRQPLVIFLLLSLTGICLQLSLRGRYSHMLTNWTPVYHPKILSSRTEALITC